MDPDVSLLLFYLVSNANGFQLDMVLSLPHGDLDLESHT